MTSKTRTLLSCFALSLFFLLAIGSSSINEIHTGAFQYKTGSEDDINDTVYVDLKNGTRIPCEQIWYGRPKAPKGSYAIDGKIIPETDIIGYKNKTGYIGLFNKWDLHRFVHGKINLYYYQYDVTSTSTTPTGFSHTSTRTATQHFYQQGDYGEIKALSNMKLVCSLVQDCPKAYELVNGKSNRQMRKLLRGEKGYLNRVFSIYNNNCQDPN